MKNKHLSFAHQYGALILFAVINLIFTVNRSFAQCPTAIAGALNICPPAYTNTLYAVLPMGSGGTWSINPDGPITIDAATGVVTGTSGGWATVTYTQGTCAPLYFSQTSTAIISPSSLCEIISTSAGTMTLSDAVGGGTWSTTAVPSLATLSSSVLTAGTGPGTANITYTLPGGYCGSNPTKAIYIDDNPTIGAGAIVPSLPLNEVCEGNPYGISTGFVSGGQMPYTYNWWWTDPYWYVNTFGSVVSYSTSETYWKPGYAGGAVPNDAGPYVANVVDYYGCASTMYAVATLTVNPLPTVYTISSGGATSGSDFGVAYALFDVNGVSCGLVAGTGSPLSFTPCGPGMHTFTANDVTTGCFWSHSAGFKQSNPTNLTQAMGVLSLVPNPNNGTFTITGGADFMQNALTVKMDITDVLGRLVLSANVAVDNGAINQGVKLTDDIADGIYHVKISCASGSQVLQLKLNR